MASEVFQLAILLTLKDAASDGLDRFGAKLRGAGKDGAKFASDFEKIRSQLNKDLAIGGIGIAGLAMIKKGVEGAADFQSAMTDLRTTLSVTSKDGKVDLDSLGRDMLKAEAIALDLGNRLPGTTQDFVEMMQVLKQNGLQAETIFKGAGKAVGELAVANKAIPKDVAKDFAQYGQLFKLRPEEYERAADVFSRLYTSTGIGSAELIEASKYFQGRTGAAIGIGGLKDAEETTRLFGLMRKQGMEGSMAGTALDNFFVQYLSEKDKMQELAKRHGIKLDFFDEKGKFKGVENLFAQLEPLRKLSDKDQAQALQGIFGQRGMAAASMMVKTGLDGWKQFNAEQDTTIGLTQKNAEIAKNYHNQMEALEGTLTNLKVAVFEPMLPGITAGVNKANELVGVIQEFVKAHPELAKWVVGLAAVGSASLVAYSGVKMLVAGVRLLKLASAFSKSEGLVGMLDATSKAAVPATRNVAGFTGSVSTAGKTSQTASRGVAGFTSSVVAADGKVKGFRNRLLSLDNVFKAVLVLETVGFTWDQITKLRGILDEEKQMQAGLTTAGQQSYKAYQQPITPEMRESLAQTHPNLVQHLERNPSREAKRMLDLLEGGNKEFSIALDPSKQSLTDWYIRNIGSLVGKDTEYPLFKSQPSRAEIMANPEWAARLTEIRQLPTAGDQRLLRMFGSPEERVGSEIAAVRHLRERAPSLAEPEVMSSFRRDIIPAMGLSPERTNFLEGVLKQAFPESFAQSMLQPLAAAGDNLTQQFSSLQEPIAGCAVSFTNLLEPTNAAVTALQTLPEPAAQANQSLVELYTSGSRVPPTLNRIVTGGTAVSNSLLTLSNSIANWRPPASPAVGVAPGAGGNPLVVPGHSVGGVVERSGFAYLHPGNLITPARTTHGLRGFDELMSLARLTKQRPDPSASVNLSFPSSGRGADTSVSLIRPRFSDEPRTRPFPFDSLRSQQSPSLLVGEVSTGPTARSIGIEPAPLDGIETLFAALSRPPERPLEARSAPAPAITVNAPLTLTINGDADESTVRAIEEKLHAHTREIGRIVGREMANSRRRA